MKELQTLKKCLACAGRVLTKYFGKISYSTKGRSDLLTKADLESQAVILDILRKVFPGHDYLAEENQRKITGSECLWVIDPLDGTTNYAHTFPMACVSIAMLHRPRRGAPAKPVIGGIFDPFKKELFLAAKGKGSTLNGKAIRVSCVKSLEKSLLFTGFAYDRAEKADFYCSFFSDFIKICHDVRRSGSAALDMAWTAAGRVDGFWEFNLNPWDVAAGRLLIEEAGGKVTDFKGLPWKDIFSCGKQTLASNGKIHAGMLQVIKRRVRNVVN